MIIDTSALVAIAVGEPGWETLRIAVLESPAIRDAARGLVETLLKKGCAVPAFEHRHAELTTIARGRYGRGMAAAACSTLAI